MHLNNCSIAAAYNAARIFACLGFGASTVRRSTSRARAAWTCAPACIDAEQFLDPSMFQVGLDDEPPLFGLCF
jgi:hypothetical protein